MRHRVAGKKLGRKTAHRVMMFRNMVTSLFDKERIRTTLDRAKAVRPIAERMITLGKREYSPCAAPGPGLCQRSRRLLPNCSSTLAPRFAQRTGGYTRIIRLGFRDGDGAQNGLSSNWSEVNSSRRKKEEGKKSKKAKKRAKRRLRLGARRRKSDESNQK